MVNSPPSFLMWSESPMWTSRADLVGWLLERMRFTSQALEACSRVLKKRAAQSHLSMRVPVMVVLLRGELGVVSCELLEEFGLGREQLRTENWERATSLD